MEEYIAKRRDLGITLHVVRSPEKETEDLWPSHEQDLRDVRFAPPEHVFTMTMLIGSDSVAVISSRRENFAMMIDSREYAELQSGLFDSLWSASTWWAQRQACIRRQRTRRRPNSDDDAGAVVDNDLLVATASAPSTPAPARRSRCRTPPPLASRTSEHTRRATGVTFCLIRVHAARCPVLSRDALSEGVCPPAQLPWVISVSALTPQAEPSPTPRALGSSASRAPNLKS
jgi:hypothetical protein